MEETWNCPHCGEPLISNAKFCPNCGSDENTGWSEDTYLDGADWRHDEWEPESEKKSSKTGRIWGVVLVLLLVVMVVLSAIR